MNPSVTLHDRATKDRLSRHAHLLYAHLTAPTRPDKPPPIQFAEGEVSFLVSYLLENPKLHPNAQAVNNAISTALVPHCWPSPGLPALKEAAGEAARNGVCGRVWKEDELAYKCKTCERDPSCVICVPCFRNGNHEGHDYAMLRINGGCCDCGDDQAWQPNGFCSNHKGACSENEDLSAVMDAGLRRSLIEAVTVVARSLYKSCTILHEACRSRSQARGTLDMLIGRSYAELVVRTTSILKWLNEVVGCGDGIRRAVGLLLTSIALRWSANEANVASACDEDTYTSWLDLMLSMDGTGMLPDRVLSTLHTFYFELITDVVFRRTFLEKFAKNYPRFIHAQIVRKYDSQDKAQDNPDNGETESDIVGNFTVQLFTVPALVPVMLQEGGLLETLLKLLCILFESASLPLSLYRQDVPFDQTNYVQRWLAAQSENFRQTMNVTDENGGSPASTEGNDEGENNIGLIRLLAKHSDGSQPDQNDDTDSGTSQPQIIDQGTRERLRLILESESTFSPVEIDSPRVPRSESDGSGNDDDDYAQYSSLPVHRMAAFEAGVRNLCPSIHCVVPNMQPDTAFAKAIVRARNNEEAALRDEVPVAHTMRLDWSDENSVGISEVWGRIMADLNYILSHPEVSFHVVHRRMDLFRLFVRLVSMFQGMHPLSRRMGDHVPTEPNLWLQGFRVEMETYHLAELLAKGFCGNEHDISGPTNAIGGNGLSLKLSRLRAIGVVRKCLDDWLDREEYREALSTYAGEYFTVAHAVSVHLPLHRLFSLFVHHAMRIDSLDLPTAMTGDLGEASGGETARLLTHPLRIQAFLAQERAKMWRRNGRIASFMSAYYRFPLSSEWFVDLDIFLQQCCAASMQTSEFVSLALKTFRIKDIPNLMDFVNSFEAKSHATNEELVRTAFNSNGETNSQESLSEMRGKEVTGIDTGILPLVPITFKEDTPNGSIFVRAPTDPKEDIASFAPILLEGLMTFFVHITSERSLCGQSEQQNLRRKLLHFLCAQDRTHSQLCRVCSFRVNHILSRESGETSTRASQVLFDRVISEIANYVEPKKMEQGRYTLKDEVWGEFDPFLPEYAVRERNAAEVRHAIAMTRRKAQVMLITDEIISARPFWKQFEGLKRLSLSLCEQHELSLATITLRETFGLSHPRRIQTTTCSAALHLLCLNVESANSTYPGSEADVWLSSSCETGSFLKSPIGILCNLVRRVTRFPTSLFSDFMPVFSRIIRESYKRCSLEDQAFLQGQLPETMRSLYAGSSGSPREGVILKADEERRRKLLAKKKEQQAAAMTRMRIAQASFAKLISEADESKSETILRQDACEDNVHEGDRNNFKSSVPGMASNHGNEHEANSDHPKVVHQCALCHEAEVSDESGPLGYIGFRQNTKLPRISKYQCKLNSHSESVSSTSVTSGRETHALETEMETSIDTAIATDFVSTKQKLIHLNLLNEGVELSKCLHISLCSHVIHMGCFERYFSSLLHSSSRRILFEGFNVVNLQRIEFLCPVCRRLANLVLPCVRFPLDGSRCNDAAMESSKLTLGANDEDFSGWLENSRLRIFDNQSSPYHVNLYGSMGRLEWSFHEGVFQTSLPFKTRASDVAEPQAAGSLLRMLERFRVSMETYSSFTTDAYGQKSRILTCSYGLPVAVTSTIASAEILARSYEWNSSSLQTTRRTLPKIFACARAQFYMSSSNQGEECRKAIQGLWNILTTEKVMLADPFVALSYLFFAWPSPLTGRDVSYLIRLSFNCFVRLSRKANSASALTRELVIFLRRVSILYWCIFPSEKPPISPCDESNISLTSRSREVEDIAQYLDVPSIGSFWTEEVNLFFSKKIVSSSTDKLVLSRIVTPKPASLKKLPSLFQTLLEGVNSSPCSKCWRVPKNPALCLVCGKVLCGPFGDNVMEITMHADMCGAGIGVFLLLKEAKIYILRGDRSVVWGSPYLDTHGEEDESLRRGTPLLLNKDRYSVLEQLWLCHGFDQDPRILVKTQRTSSPRDVIPTLRPLGPIAAVRPLH